MKEGVDTDTEELFHVLMNQYGDEVLRFIYLQVHDLGLAEDLTQETFLKAYRGLPRFRGESSHRTWIYSIARNVCRDHVRKSRVSQVDLDACPLVHPDNLEDSVAGRLEAQRLLECLKRLDVSRRMVTVLYYLQDWSAADIAKSLHLPVGTVRSKLLRAKAKLADCLGGEVNV